jgi:CO dehydrogenase nickel-insertion accessory protein CooC1
LKLAVSGKGGTGNTLLLVLLTSIFAEFVHSALLVYSNLSKINILTSIKTVLSTVYENLFNLISSTVIPEAKINL